MTPDDRADYYCKKAKEYLEQGFGTREAHLKANKDLKGKCDVSQRQIGESTRPFRDGFHVLPEKIEEHLDSTLNVPEDDDTGDYSPPEQKGQWIKDGEYHFDESTGEYLVHLDSAGDLVTIPKEKMEKIWEWYSNWTGDTNTINQICQKIGFPRTWFNELRRKMGLTHDREPFTPEEMVSKDSEQLVDDLLQKRRRELAEKWENKQLEKIKEEAEKYRAIDQGQIKPLQNALSQIDCVDYDTEYQIKTLSEGADCEDYAALFGLADCHIGYSDFDEEEWTIRDSGAKVISAFQKVLKRTLRHGTPDKIILAFLGDFFHVDREQLETSYGTSLEAEGRIEEILKEGYRVAHNVIDMARKVTDVSIRVVEGNHDRVTSKGMAIHLDKHFTDCDMDLNFRERQYLQYEENLLCLWHGDTVSDVDIPNVIADEASELWGQTDNRFVCYGHIHPERINDEPRGVTLLRLAGPSGRDEYDYSHGYDPTNTLTALRLHPTEGKIGIDYAT